MQLLTLGLNYETATIDVRERAAFAPEHVAPAVENMLHQGVVDEVAILSTCNRTELYCRPACNDSSASVRTVAKWLSDYRGLPENFIQQHTYNYPGERAVKHAFRVASGLDSMVLGEPQILGQMKQAFSVAQQAGGTGKVLNRLFQQTFSVAKQVRTDTSIGENPVSVAFAAVNLAKRLFADLANKTVLLIGAGETIELVAQHLTEKGVTHVMVANRNIERARLLVNQRGAQQNWEAISLAAMPKRLPDADIIVSATASTLPILGKGLIESALKIRKHKPQFIVDLAVPRDVEPEVASLPDAYLYCVDDLNQIVDQNRTARQDAAQAAEKIIDLQVVRFMHWLRALNSVPTIKQLRQSIDAIKEAELERARKRLAAGGDPEEVLNRLANTLTGKFTHHPSSVLKTAEIDGDRALVNAARKLFNLPK
ncbi:MAG: glutamyl-tRNA reductase [Arenicellales bacterium WSBS_2016_MAG_OTU3]